MMSKTSGKRCLYEEERNIGNAVRNTVRNMAYNLENVITNLHGIVGDLHLLVAQIDTVTNKIDGRNGMKVRENGRAPYTSSLNSLDRSSTKSSSQGIMSKNIKHWQSLIENYETPDFSPDLDWSYLSLTETEKAESMEKLFGLYEKRKIAHTTKITNAHPDATGLTLSKDSDVLCPNSAITELSPSSDVSYGDGACCDPKSSSPYDGYYEKLADDVLENMTSENVNGDSDFSDDEYVVSPILSTPSPSTSSDTGASSGSSLEFQAEYDRHVNPWTTFSTVVNTLDSEDAFSVDDILNDNYIEASYYNYSFEDSFKTLEVS